MMRSLRDFFMRGREVFYPFESRLLDDVKTRLQEGGRDRLQRQIAAINRVQRLAKGKEVNLYRTRRGKPAFDEDLRFPDASDEALLATVTLIHPEKRTNLRVEVWLAKGRLFSLVFNKSPVEFFARVDLASVEPEIADVKIWIDPMEPRPIDASRPADGAALGGWLRGWFSKGVVTNLRSSLPQSMLASFVERIDAKLPADYLELVSQTEGVTLASCEVYGAAGIRKIVWPSDNYYVLAEMEGRGALTVKESDRNGELYFLSYEDNTERFVGTSFEKAVVSLLDLDE